MHQEWRTAYLQRLAEGLAVLSLATERLIVDAGSETLAAAREKSGLNAMDALHLALASVAKADFFATTDGKLLRKAKTHAGISCKPVSILELASEVNK